MKNKPYQEWELTRITASTLGVFFGLFSGINHGIFEILQGNKPINGLVINAIGEMQRFWPEGTEPAFTPDPELSDHRHRIHPGWHRDHHLVNLVPSRQARTDCLSRTVHFKFPGWRWYGAGFLLHSSLGFRHTHGKTTQRLAENSPAQDLAGPFQTLDRAAYRSYRYHADRPGDGNFWILPGSH